MGSPQLRVFWQELQFLRHHVPDLAVGEPGLRLHDHRVLVVHLECVGHGNAELSFLRGEEAEGAHEGLWPPLSPILDHGECSVQQGEANS